MEIVYIYDIKAKNKKKFNRTKRVFYYHLAKLELEPSSWKTKSTIAVSTKKERMMDKFFHRFGNNIEVYKLVVESIEEL